MKTLSKVQIAKKEDLLAQMKKAFGQLSDAVTSVNAQLTNKFDDLSENLEDDDVETYIQAYNDARTEGAAEIDQAQTEYNDLIEDEINPFIREVHDALQAHYDEKSEKWQEGDAGQAFNSWIEAWDVEYDSIELEVPENDLELKKLIGVSIDDHQPNEIDDPDDSDVEAFEKLPTSVDDV